MEQKLDLARHLPAAAGGGYFNTGTNGPLSLAAWQATRAAAEEEFSAGRVGPGLLERHRTQRTAARRAVAELLGAGEGEIALTHHTTEGMNIAAWSLPWRRGEAVLLSDQEHQGGVLPVGALRRRFGLEVRLFDAAGAATHVAAQLALGRVRLVVLSHVSYSTGRLLPVEEIAELAHRHGALVAVDGAQSTGAIPVDAHGLGVDFYALPGQKWLCGPDGTGALYVREDRISAALQTFIGHSSVQSWDEAGEFMPQRGAARFEVGTLNLPNLVGWTAGLSWLATEVGWPWAHARTRRLAARLREALAGQSRVEVLTPPEHAGLIAFRVRDREPAAVVAALAEAGYIVRSIPRPSCVRASVAWFHDESAVDGLAGAVAALA